MCLESRPDNSSCVQQTLLDVPWLWHPAHAEKSFPCVKDTPAVSFTLTCDHLLLWTVSFLFPAEHPIQHGTSIPCQTLLDPDMTSTSKCISFVSLLCCLGSSSLILHHRAHHRSNDLELSNSNGSFHHSWEWLGFSGSPKEEITLSWRDWPSFKIVSNLHLRTLPHG